MSQEMQPTQMTDAQKAQKQRENILKIVNTVLFYGLI
jgi:hypothetical protein